MRAAWLPLLAGLAAVFALFHVTADALGSDRGQAGLAIAAIVVAALVAVEGLLFGQSPGAGLRALGLGMPQCTGMAVAAALCAALLIVVPLYASLRGTTVIPYSGWALLIPGLFAQAGIAEETLFPGYRFRHLRRGRTFWRAASLAMLPFVAVHLIMFATLPWPVALAAVLLAVVMSFPFAHLYEIGGRTIWAPALLHTAVQGTVKVLEVAGDSAFPIVWMAASATLPYLAFLIRRPTA